jgi:hypothetical protein
MFFKDFGSWVAHVAEAVHFESRERAWKFIYDERVADVAVRDLSEQASADLARIQR